MFPRVTELFLEKKNNVIGFLILKAIFSMLGHFSRTFQFSSGRFFGFNFCPFQLCFLEGKNAAHSCTLPCEH